MAVTESLLVSVQADTSKAVSSLELMTKSLDSLDGKLNDINKSSTSSVKSLNGFGFAAVKINQTLELTKKVMTGLISPITKMAGDFLKAQDATLQLSKTLKVLGEKNIAQTVNRFADLGNQIEEMTNIESEAIVGLANLGVSIGLTDDQLEKFIRTAVDISKVLDIDVDSAFQRLLSTMKGNEKALGPLSGLLKDLTKSELEAGKAADILGEKLRGMGNAVGLIEQIRAVFIKLGDIGEEIGEIFVKGLNIESSAKATNELLVSIRSSIISIKQPSIDLLNTIRALFIGFIDGIKAINFDAILSQMNSFIGLTLRLSAAFAGLALAMNSQAFIVFVTNLGTMAATMTKLSVATGLATLKFTLMATAITSVIVALDFLAANASRLPDAFLSGLTVIRTGFLSLFENLFRAVGFESFANKIKSEADKLAESAVKMSENLDPGFLISSFDQATVAIGRFQSSFNETTKKSEELNQELDKTSSTSRRVINNFKTMSDEGSKIFDELVKKTSELNKEYQDLGATEGQKIQNTLNLRLEEIKILEDKLIKENSLNDSAKKQLDIARELGKNISFKKTDELRKNNLEEQTALYKSIKNQIFDIDAAAIDKINNQKQADLEEISKRRQKLLLDKEINKEALLQLDSSEKLIEQRARLMSMQVPSKEFEIAKTFGTNIASNITQAFQTGATGAVMGAMTGVGAIADAVQGLIDFVPQLLDKITNVFTSLTELPMKVVEGFGKLGDSILKFVSDFIPNMINMIPALLEKFIAFFANLPDVFAGLLEKLPDMLTGLLDRLPDLVEQFVEKLVQMSPKIIVSLINFLVKKAPYIAKELALAMAIEIPAAIINGILDAIKSLPKIFKGLGKSVIPKPAEIAKSFGLALKTVGKNLTGVGSKLFAVMDLEEGAKTQAENLADFAKTVEDSINSQIEKVFKASEKLLQSLIDAWRWIYENLIAPIAKLLKDTWMFIYDNLLLPFINILKSAWDFVIKLFLDAWEVVKVIWQSLLNILQSTWSNMMVALQAAWNIVKTIWDTMINILSSTWNMIKNIWQTLMDLFTSKISIFEAVFKIGSAILNQVATVFQSVFNNAGYIFENAAKIFLSVFAQVRTIFDSLVSIGSKIWDHLKSSFSGIGAIIQNALNAINPMGIFSKIFAIPSNAFGSKGTIEKALGIDMPFMSFARGGKVPGQSSVGGDSMINDKILALLSPGEIVIPRSVLEDPLNRKIIENLMANGKVPKFAKGGVIGSAMKSLGHAASPIVDAISDVVPSFDPKGFWNEVGNKLGQAVMKIFESNKFKDGGQVPAILHSGEFVLNRGAVDRVGTGFLENLNSGNMNNRPSPVINNTITLTINTTQPIDENFVKNKIYPLVKEQIKRASIDGQTLVYAPGVRKL